MGSEPLGCPHQRPGLTQLFALARTKALGGLVEEATRRRPSGIDEQRPFAKTFCDGSVEAIDLKLDLAIGEGKAKSSRKIVAVNGGADVFQH